MTLPSVLPLIGLEGITLRASSHRDRSAGVCAMEAVAWLAGEPHSDAPQCACPVIGAFLRSWNDALPDDATRTLLLRPLLPLVLNTRSTKAVEVKRSYLALDWLARVHAPAWLSLRDGAALAPTVKELQQSASDLVRAMCAVTPQDEDPR